MFYYLVQDLKALIFSLIALHFKVGGSRPFLERTDHSWRGRAILAADPFSSRSNPSDVFRLTPPYGDMIKDSLMSDVNRFSTITKHILILMLIQDYLGPGLG